MGIALRLMKDRDLAEEVVHDAFVKVWKSISDYDSSRGRLYTWMARICRNTALDHLKSKRFKNNSKTDTIGFDVPTGAAWSEEGLNVDTIGVKEWLVALNDDQRAVFEAVYFKGMSHSQTAEELDTPLGTVKTRLRSGLIAIRKKLGLQ